MEVVGICSIFEHLRSVLLIYYNEVQEHMPQGVTLHYTDIFVHRSKLVLRGQTAFFRFPHKEKRKKQSGHAKD